jgi:hypothetical protein
MEATDLVFMRWHSWWKVDGEGCCGGSPCRVIWWLLCTKEIEGMEKSAKMGPRFLNHSIPRTTSAPSIGRREKGI